MAQKGVIGSETNVSTLTGNNDSGVYGFFIENSLPIGIPADAVRGVLIVANQQGNLLQIISCYERNKVWRRVGISSNFKDWIEI